MPTELEKAFDELDATDLQALTEHALARVRAGEWSSDIARVIFQQAEMFHGELAAERLAKQVAAELERKGGL